jgi:hypothetical protein
MQRLAPEFSGALDSMFQSAAKTAYPYLFDNLKKKPADALSRGAFDYIGKPEEIVAFTKEMFGWGGHPMQHAVGLYESEKKKPWSAASEKEKEAYYQKGLQVFKDKMNATKGVPAAFRHFIKIYNQPQGKALLDQLGRTIVSNDQMPDQQGGVGYA